ncbi:hypothetical protein ACLOJK_025693 [Asimina triloba]
MVFEDFFTLTEMKDGLTTLSRVEELVSAMRKQREDAAENVSDAFRQRSIIASTLSVTEDKDCLTHFIQLDGFQFLDQWLQEAQGCGRDENGSSQEETIKALLGVLEKLPLDSDCVTASGIAETIKNLMDDKSLKIQDRARLLFDRWIHAGIKDPRHKDAEISVSHHDGNTNFLPDMKIPGEEGCLKSVVPNSCSSKSAGGRSLVESTEDEQQQPDTARSANVSPPQISEGVQVEMSKDVSSVITSNSASIDGSIGDINAPVFVPSKTFQASSSIADKSHTCQGEGTNSLELQSSVLPNYVGKHDDSSDIPEIPCMYNNAEETNNQINVMDGSQNKVSREEACAVSTCSEPNEMVSSSTYPANVEKCATEPAASHKNDENEGESCARSPVSADCTHDYGKFEAEKNAVSKNSVNTSELTSAGQDGDKVLLDFPTFSGSILSKVEGTKTSGRKDILGKSINFQKLSRKSDAKLKRKRDPVSRHDIFKAVMDTKESGNTCHQGKLEMELDCGVDDALEVARLVAKEVEQEVVDYRAQFCTSSDQSLEGDTNQPSSPDSVEIMQDDPMMESLNVNESLSEHELADDSSSVKAKRSRVSKGSSTEQSYCKDDSESPHSTAAVQESFCNRDKSKCNFDLNEDVKETDCSAVPISCLANASLIPEAIIAPSGASGSKSALCPASPRTTGVGEKASFAEARSNCSKQRFLQIDLNVADCDNDLAVDLISTKCALPSSGLQSGDSSVEMNSRKGDKLNLDLNCLGHDEDPCAFPSSDWRVERQSQYNHSGNCSPSASSSSSRHPSKTNFDLNDSPSFFDPCSSHQQQQGLNRVFSQSISTCGNFKLDDPVVSLMGARISVNSTASFLEKGQSTGTSINGATSTRFGGGSGAQHVASYTPMLPTMFGYDGITNGPTMPTNSQVYGASGSIPYLVDSRGTPLLPQILNSTSAVSPDLHRPPFLMNLMGPPSGLIGISTSRPSLDLNSSMMVVDSENREVGRLRQLFFQGQSGL